MHDLDLNPEFSEALHLLETSPNNLFITGKAGTGKSTLLDYFRTKTTKQIVVLAPTGVAALNVKGQTIHSFFRFPFQMTKESIYDLKPPASLIKILNKTDVIIIDEISMVRADLFDYIDLALQLFLHSDEPFGGKKIAVIGDLYQLPPVVTNEDREMIQHQYASPYFFSADCFHPEKWDLCELTKIYRQSDAKFIDLLNKVRDNRITEEELDWLNHNNLATKETETKCSITLTTTNRTADKINQQALANVPSKVHRLAGKVTGDFNSKFLPTNEELIIKVGAQVMLLHNDSQGQFVNGSLGQVTALSFNDSQERLLHIRLSNHKNIVVGPHTWEIHKYKYNPTENRVETEIMGSFKQYPLKLAWAITIHKSQGKTFDSATIDIGNGAFAHGQVYVALSRCRSFQGLQLQKPIQKRHIWQNHAVDNFFAYFKQNELG